MEAKGTPIYEPILKGLRFMTSWLNPLSYRYDESFNQAVPGAFNKPGLLYRLGFTTTADFPTGSTNQNPSSSERVSYDLGSGFTFLTGITTTVNYRRSVNRDLVTIGRDRFESRSTSWPDLTIRIQKFRSLPLIKPYVKWFIDVFAPRTAYNRTVSEDFNISDGFSTGKTETVSQNPVLSINFRLFRSLSITGSYSTTETNEDRRNRVSGQPVSETRTNRTTYAISGKYSFSAPGGIGLPLLGKLKFKSTVSIDVNVKFGSNLSETSTKSIDDKGNVTSGPFVVGTDNSDFSVSPVISIGRHTCARYRSGLRSGSSEACFQLT